MIWLLALAFTLLWASPADAAPLGAALSTIIGGGLAKTLAAGGLAKTLAAGGINAFLLRTAASVTLSALSQYLSPRPKIGIGTDSITTGDTTPQGFILGRTATAGHLLAPAYVDGSWLWYVLDLSNKPITGVVRLAVNDEWLTLDDVTSSRGLDLVAQAGDDDSRYADRVHARFYDGTQTEADARLLHYFADHDTRPWQSDMIGTGTAYAIVAFQQTRQRLFQGLPRVLFEVDGIPLYDPRKDTTVGGSGAHRWADQSTWEFTRNPAVMIYNIARGITLGDGRVWGYGYAADRLPLAPWFAAMNECDVAVDLDGGGTEPQYQAGIEVKTGPQELGGTHPAEIVAELLKSCSGEIAETGGSMTIRVGAPALPVLFITDDDLNTARDTQFDPFPGLQSTQNGVTATYPDPAAIYKPKEAPPRYSSELEADDFDQRLAVALQFQAVTSGTQVQRIMQALVDDQRRFRRHVVVLPPRAAILDPLDTIEWSSAENGYEDKLFEVRAVAHEARTLLQGVTLRERDPADYDWSSEFELPSPTPAPRVPVRADSFPASWALAATVIRDGAENDRRPALRMTWTLGDQVDADGVEWQVRVTGTTALVAQGSTTDAITGEQVVSDGILPATAYEARGRLVARRPTGWTDWASATTGDIRLGAVDLSDALNGVIDGAEAAADEALAEAREALAGASAVSNALANADEDAAARAILDLVRSADARETLRAAVVRETIARSEGDVALAIVTEALAAEIASAAAAIVTEALARAEGDSALAALITSLTATVDGNTAAITAESVARADGDTALASDITTVEATVGDLSASVSTQATAIADIEGNLSATYSLVVQGSGGAARLVLVSSDDPSGTPFTGVSLDADYVFIGGALKSDDYSAGTAGWRITQAGDAELNSLTVRTAMLEANAASRTATGTGTQETSGFTWATAATATLTGVTSGTDLIVLVNGMGRAIGSGSEATAYMRYRITLNNVEQRIRNDFIIAQGNSGSSLRKALIAEALLLTAAAGTNTVRLQVSLGDGSGTVGIDDGSVIVFERKR